MDVSRVDDPAQRNAVWSQGLVQTFLAAGPRHVVISPGSRSTPLVLAFTAHPNARTHTLLDERSAAFFALGLARARGEAVFLLCTSGSAAAHYGPAVVEAAQSDVPLVVLTADRPPEHQGCGAAQTMPQGRLYGVHVRFAADLAPPEAAGMPQAWQTAAAQALDAAEGTRPGPVHLNIPFREPLWQPNVELAPWSSWASVPRICRAALQVPSESLDALVPQLRAAQRGVIVCGPRAFASQHDAATVHALAARLGWPVLAEPTSQARLGHPSAIGAYDALLRDPRFVENHAPDCVLRFGQMPTSKATGQWLARYGAGRTVLVEPHGVYLDPTHGVHQVIAAPAAAFCRALLACLTAPAPADSPWLASWRRAAAAADRTLRHECSVGFWQGSVAQTLVDCLPPAAALHVASSLSIRDVDAFGRSAQGVTVFCSRGTNGIDGTLATLLGEASGHSGPLVGLMGDLAFLHDVGSLHLGRQIRLPVTVVVVNNQGGAIFDTLPVAAHPTAYVEHFRTPQTADIAALCAASAVPWRQADSDATLRQALAEWLPTPGLKIIEATVGPARYAEAFAAVARAWHQQGA